MIQIISFICFGASVFCYAISQLQLHGKLKWSKGYYGFWDERSYERKYKRNVDADPLGWEKYPAPSTWYYKFFVIKYIERFPLSATLLVFLTDGYHLMQFCFKIFLCASFIPYTGWQITVALWVTWGIVFTVFYKLLSR